LRKDIQELIQANKLCVLATVSDGEPHCSLMSYATNDDCRKLYMATRTQTKKYRNMMANPYVSLLVDSRQDIGASPAAPTKALTISGTFQTDVGREEIMNGRQRLLEQHPDLKEMLHDADVELIIVKISKVQLLNGIADAYFEIVS